MSKSGGGKRSSTGSMGGTLQVRDEYQALKEGIRNGRTMAPYSGCMMCLGTAELV